jgi:hypothetical protein
MVIWFPEAGPWSPRLEDCNRPNGRGQLLVVCLVSVGIELGATLLLASVRA